MQIRPLIITAELQARFRALRTLAEGAPTPLATLKKLSKSFDTGAALTPFPNQTMDLPFGYRITFTVDQQPRARCRHLSVSVSEVGQLPGIEAVKMLMGEFGFINQLERCVVYLETFVPGHQAVNVVEPINGNMSEIQTTPGRA